VLPQRNDVRQEGNDNEVDGTVAGDLIRDAHVSASRVVDLGL
jgi:hypothetical protein